MREPQDLGTALWSLQLHLQHQHPHHCDPQTNLPLAELLSGPWACPAPLLLLLVRLSSIDSKLGLNLALIGREVHGVIENNKQAYDSDRARMPTAGHTPMLHCSHGDFDFQGIDLTD